MKRAHRETRDDRAELLGPIQTPEYLRPFVASLLSLPEDKVHPQ